MSSTWDRSTRRRTLLRILLNLDAKCLKAIQTWLSAYGHREIVRDKPIASITLTDRIITEPAGNNLAYCLP